MFLFYFYWVLAGLIRVFLYLFAIGFDGILSLSWLIPLYLASAFAVFALHFILAFFWSLLIKNAPPPKKPHKIYACLTVETIDIINRFAGVRTKGFDVGALPKEPCLFVCNHLSNFDPMVLAVHLKNRPLCFISKEGNFKIPSAGPFINKAGYSKIDRLDSMEALTAVYTAVDRLKSGVSVGVYPEGTRSKTGELLPFKEGVFLIAKKADVPIVVLTIDGTPQIHKNFFRRSTTVNLRLAGIIDREIVSSMRSGALSRIAKEMVEKTL